MKIKGKTFQRKNHKSSLKRIGTGVGLGLLSLCIFTLFFLSSVSNVWNMDWQSPAYALIGIFIGIAFVLFLIFNKEKLSLFFRWTGILIGLGLFTIIVSITLLALVPQTGYPINLAASVLISLLLFFSLKKGTLSFTDSIRKNWHTGIFLGITLLFMLYHPLTIIHFVYEADKVGRERMENNPAKKLASIMPPFAEEHNLTKIEEYNGAVVGFLSDNTIPFYIYIYQGNQSLDEMKNLVETYLSSQGYQITDNLYTYDENCSSTTIELDCDENSLRGSTINNNKPYWVFKGSNSAGDSISGEISDYTYFNSANKVETFGEHPVPSGKTVVVIDFVSHDVN